MSLKIIANNENPPIGGLIIADLIKDAKPVLIHWGGATSKETVIVFPNSTELVCQNNTDVLRVLAREAPAFQLYGNTPAERTQIDHWITFSLTMNSDLAANLTTLNKCLGPTTYLVSNKLTIGDLAVFAELYAESDESQKLFPIHVKRWFNLISSHSSTKHVIATIPKAIKKPRPAEKSGSIEKIERKQEGKFVDLPGAEIGKVVVRFPPEASGYLHIGHAKAALLNQYYQQAFQGQFIMRFDDTNPAKENVDFEKVILGDVEMLEIKPDLYTYTSDYFELMLKYCEEMITNGQAYVDDTEPEQMKKEREQRTESANRSNSVDKNMAMWKEMLLGSAQGQKCCVRAKIDMSSNNGCMRDPTIYRCKNEPHPRTGTKYKVYPTYDFACPIVDAIENVTHTLRTMEYHDRDDQFYWFIDQLKLRKPYIWEYARLNMTNTVLSKRRLTWFVDQGLVDGWDDPRFPTVRGILRRGMTVEGLKQFIIAQGSSKSVVFMEWDKIWAFNKKVIDPIAPRYTALEKVDNVVVNVAGAKSGTIQVPVHPKNSDIGMKTVALGPKILIDYVDAETLKEGENATFINWGNVMINKINKTNGKITSVDATLNLEDKDFKKTLKLTWLAQLDAQEYTPTYCVYFDHIISKAVLGKDEDFKQHIGRDTRTEVPMLGDPELKKLKKGDIIQLQRRGFFKVDSAYEPTSQYTGISGPIILFSIPDGHQKETSSAGNIKKVKPEVQNSNKNANTSSGDLTSINEKIIKQGDLVRQLKTDKAEKAKVDEAVKALLDLKAEYKKISGSDWKPGVTQSPAAPLPAAAIQSIGGGDLNEKIIKQGELVRDLKSQKAEKGKIDTQVKVLLELKAEFKKATGSDWKPGATSSEPAKPASNTGASGDTNALNDKITQQGDLVRNLKTQKADKAKIEDAVKGLLELKAEYKKVTGSDWKPVAVPSVVSKSSASTKPSAGGESSDLNNKITKQGDLVRVLKSEKADKAKVDAAVKDLLILKAEYKKVTGSDWKPGAQPAASSNTSNSTVPSSDTSSVNTKIATQGDLVRNLKLQKADKTKIDAAVKQLLVLKAEYKTVTGNDWKPEAVQNTKAAKPTATTMPVNNEAAKESLTKKINDQGDVVRTLKTNKASSKSDVDTAVKALLDLKGEYKKLFGIDFPTAGRAPKQEEKSKQKPEPAKLVKEDGAGAKKQTRLGLEATKEENLPDWYSQVITKGELIEYYDVSGCYILRHWSFAIWKIIKNWFDNEITKMGVKECYFPIFVSRAALEKEKTHIADFAPEVAWVTRSGETELAEPIAVRPTSETIMYPAYAKWVQSYRDLPIRLNQWNNVVRWEFKHPQPFLRTREFLWQEGHTAFANAKEAQEEVLDILELYAQVYTDLLAIPVVKGRKTEKEKFAGGDYTTTVEAFISASGRAIQGATSHHLGQNFSKMFDIVFEHPETQQKEYVYQNSWGLTTRTIGVMVMVHADNQGLVLPPRVACIQVVIVPCGVTVSMKDAERDELIKSCNELVATLKSRDVRVEGDFRDNYSPGWKFNHWELKGVPIRIELGPKDLKAKQFVAVRRDTGEKITIARDQSADKITQLLEDIHKSMLGKATNDMTSHTKITKDWTEFCNLLDQRNIIMAPFCGEGTCEETIKAESAKDDSTAEAGAPSMGAKSLCIPFDQPATIAADDKCVHPQCNAKPKFYTLFGRSY